MAARKVKEPTRTRALNARREAINESFRTRHPDVAAEQRVLRKAQSTLQADWRHKRAATPETLEKASSVRQGALFRLAMGGALSADQLAWAGEVRIVFERIGADASIGTVSLETRVDQSPRFGGTFFEKLGAVRAEVAYTAWRQALPRPGPVLAMIVEDLGCRAAERRFRLKSGSATQLLLQALDAWPDYQRDARDRIHEATLLAAQAAIL